MDRAEVLNLINTVLCSSFFAVNLILVIYLFIRVKLRLDPAMIAITLLYLVQHLFKLPFLTNGGIGFNPFNSLAMALIFMN